MSRPRGSRLRRVATLAFGALCLVLLTPTGPHAQVPDEQLLQPPFVPRTVLVMDPVRGWDLTGGDAAAIDTAEMVRSIRMTIAADPRYELLDAPIPRSDTRAAAEQRTALAQQRIGLGMDLYRADRAAEAAASLESATRGFSEGTLRWTDAGLVAEAWRTLAFAHLELSAAGAESAVRSETRAAIAFREMIRHLTPDLVDPAVWPPAVADIYEQQLLTHAASRGHDLRVRVSEARAAAELFDADELLFVTVVQDEGGSTAALQFFDTESGSFHAIEVVESPDVGVDLASLAGAAISRVAACQRLAPPAPVDEDLEAGSVYLAAGYTVRAFLDRPTRRSFANHGVGLLGEVMVTGSVGVYAGANLHFSRPDRLHDLLNRVNTFSGSLGGVFAWRGHSGRVFLRAGAEMSRVGDLRATTEYWCKVSRGEAQQFDSMRACTPSDLTIEDASPHFGLAVAVGGSVRIFGPVWFYAQAEVSLFVTPLDSVPLAFPAGGGAGVSYRF